MTEFEEIDGVLFQVCDHEFTSWSPILNPKDNMNKRYCKKCRTYQYLIPKLENLPEKKKWWGW